MVCYVNLMRQLLKHLKLINLDDYLDNKSTSFYFSLHPWFGWYFVVESISSKKTSLLLTNFKVAFVSQLFSFIYLSIIDYSVEARSWIFPSYQSVLAKDSRFCVFQRYVGCLVFLNGLALLAIIFDHIILFITYILELATLLPDSSAFIVLNFNFVVGTWLPELWRSLHNGFYLLSAIILKDDFETRFRYRRGWFLFSMEWWSAIAVSSDNVGQNVFDRFFIEVTFGLKVAGAALLVKLWVAEGWQLLWEKAVNTFHDIVCNHLFNYF